MKKEKTLKMCDGMLEDMLRSIPDGELLKAFREEENLDLKFEWQDLVRAMPCLDYMDFAEELYILIKEKKEEIWNAENIKDKIRILDNLIKYIENNYPLDAVYLNWQLLINKDKFTIIFDKKDLSDEDKNKAFELLKDIAIFANKDSGDQTDKYIEKNKEICENLISLSVSTLYYYLEDSYFQNKYIFLIDRRKSTNNIVRW